MILSASPDVSSDAIQEPEFLVKPALIVVITLIGLKILPVFSVLVMLILVMYAWRGPEASLQALTLMFIVINLNPGLFPASGQGLSLRWLILFSAFGQLIWGSVFRDARWPLNFVAVLVLYAAVVICLSVLSSRLPAVSIFKSIAFCLGSVTVLTCFYRTRDLRHRWLSWFFTIYIVVLACSLPLYFTPTGFFTNGRGFQGIMSHPQTFGPIMTPMTAALSALLFFRQSRSMLVAGGALVGLFAIYASQSRTALLMYAVSLLITASCWLLRSRRFHRQGSGIFSPGLKLIGFVVCCVVLVQKGDAVGAAIERFLLKQNENAQSHSFEVRMSMLDRQMENFYSAPMTGIGFGLPSNVDDWTSLSQGFMGIPTGFPVEKGFLPSAVLEETGIIGMVLFIVLIGFLLIRVLGHGAFPHVALILACVLANTGEMVFFSFGGPGLYYWLLMGFAYTQSIRPRALRVTSQKASSVQAMFA